MKELRINGERLWQSLIDLAKIGATAKGGVCRIALTDRDREGCAQLPFVESRGFSWAILAANAMHMIGRNRHPVEQGLARHSRVTGCVIRRHATLIAPEDLRAGPVYPSGVGGTREPFIQRLRGHSSRQRHDESAARAHRRCGRRNNAFGRARRERVTRREYANIRVLRRLRSSLPGA